MDLPSPRRGHRPLRRRRRPDAATAPGTDTTGTHSSGSAAASPGTSPAEPLPQPPPDRTPPDRTLWQLLDALQVPMERRTAAAMRPLEDLPVERMLGLGPADMDRRELLKRTTLDEELTDRLWRAMGFARPDDRSRPFTEADLRMLQGLGGLLSVEVVDEDVALWLTRITASPVSRLAEAQASLFVDQLLDLTDGDPSPAQTVQFAEVLSDTVVPLVAQMVDYMWRRHLVAGVRRRLVLAAAVEHQPQGVGFADLVDSTLLGADRDERGIAAVLGRFEATALDVMADHGVRLVKAIGDEVMFAGPSEQAVEAGLSLLDACAADPDLPGLRVGITRGAVAETAGDLYGASVNLASRLVERARPGTLVVDEPTALVLPPERFSASRFRWKGPEVAGISEVRPHRVLRVADSTPADAG